ncbi:hypothetical protein EON65_36605 [archaeon]|nr:MAG: hypothetical protein EON65_36605 [archaeon]
MSRTSKAAARAELVTWLLQHATGFTDEDADSCATKCLSMGCNTIDLLVEEFEVRKQEAGAEGVNDLLSSLVEATPLRRRLRQALEFSMHAPSTNASPTSLLGASPFTAVRTSGALDGTRGPAMFMSESTVLVAESTVSFSNNFLVSTIHMFNDLSSSYNRALLLLPCPLAVMHSLTTPLGRL